MINEAHNENKPLTALNEVLEFDKAINMAKMMVMDSDTIILALSDVGSTLSIAGNSQSLKSKPLEEAGKDDDNIPYLTLSYATGPTHKKFYDSKRKNPFDIIDQIESDSDKICPSSISTSKGMNGGEDIIGLSKLYIK